MILIVNKTQEQMPIIGVLVSVVYPDGKRRHHEALAVVPDINPMKRADMLMAEALITFPVSEGYAGHIVEGMERVETLGPAAFYGDTE